MRISDWSSDVCSSDLVQQITLRFGQGDAGTVATIEPWHLERHLLALEPGVEPDERNDRVGIGSHRNRLIAQRRDGRLPGAGDVARACRLVREVKRAGTRTLIVELDAHPLALALPLVARGGEALVRPPAVAMGSPPGR